jgi:hypothetical protein
MVESCFGDTLALVRELREGESIARRAGGHREGIGVDGGELFWGHPGFGARTTPREKHRTGGGIYLGDADTPIRGDLCR